MIQNKYLLLGKRPEANDNPTIYKRDKNQNVKASKKIDSQKNRPVPVYWESVEYAECKYFAMVRAYRFVFRKQVQSRAVSADSWTIVATLNGDFIALYQKNW